MLAPRTWIHSNTVDLDAPTGPPRLGDSAAGLPIEATPLPPERDWQYTLVEMLAKLEVGRQRLAGVRLGSDSEYLYDQLEQMVQLAEEVAKGASFNDASAAAQMSAMAKGGAVYVHLNSTRRPANRSLLKSMLSKFGPEEDSTAPAAREALHLAVEALHAYFSLFTDRYGSGKAARGWVDAASSYLGDFKSLARDLGE